MLLRCPWCGLRNVSEFVCRGELTPRPDPATATPAQWREYLYLRDNRRGPTVERWFHRMGCRRHLVVERDTETNQSHDRTEDPEP
ncbi:MAG: sarcosine oxidase subunit delta [Micromonosporaceae bacterium]